MTNYLPVEFRNERYRKCIRCTQRFNNILLRVVAYFQGFKSSLGDIAYSYDVCINLVPYYYV